MSVRDDPVLFLRGGKGGNAFGTVAGGNATTTAVTHRLDGPEHASADDTTRLDASTTQHGLLPKLSGDPTDALLGDGTFAPPPEPVAVAHIADTTDAHHSSAISIADAGGYYTGTDVETALQELGAAVLAPALWVPVMVEDGATGLWYVAVTGDGDAVMTEVS